MPCEVVLLRVYFFKMAADAMETAKMLKNLKNTGMIMNCHCKAIADITPPHYFGTSVSMVTPF
jgi:hypothetical protein